MILGERLRTLYVVDMDSLDVGWCRFVQPAFLITDAVMTLYLRSEKLTDRLMRRLIVRTRTMEDAESDERVYICRRAPSHNRRNMSSSQLLMHAITVFHSDRCSCIPCGPYLRAQITIIVYSGANDSEAALSERRMWRQRRRLDHGTHFFNSTGNARQRTGNSSTRSSHSAPVLREVSHLI